MEEYNSKGQIGGAPPWRLFLLASEGITSSDSKETEFQLLPAQRNIFSVVGFLL